MGEGGGSRTPSRRHTPPWGPRRRRVRTHARIRRTARSGPLARRASDVDRSVHSRAWRRRHVATVVGEQRASLAICRSDALGWVRTRSAKSIRWVGYCLPSRPSRGLSRCVIDDAGRPAVPCGGAFRRRRTVASLTPAASAMRRLLQAGRSSISLSTPWRRSARVRGRPWAVLARSATSSSSASSPSTHWTATEWSPRAVAAAARWCPSSTRPVSRWTSSGLHWSSTSMRSATCSALTGRSGAVSVSAVRGTCAGPVDSTPGVLSFLVMRRTVLSSCVTAVAPRRVGTAPRRCGHERGEHLAVLPTSSTSAVQRARW